MSSGKQGEGHSPSTQRKAILARAHADGYLMEEEDIYEDRQSGHKLTRKGYVAILRGVRDGRYRAVYVFMLDRWGRDSIERQQRGKEFDKLDVPLISVVEGVDEPGLVRVIRAELAEEESRKNALRVTPNRERAAREGTHCGMTPYGCIRLYPEHTGGHQPAGILVPHEPEAGIVRELFARYASGQWSTRDLAADLNNRGVPGPSKPQEGRPAPRWSTGTVCRVLRNPTYAGRVRYNNKPQGRFVKAAQGSAFTVEGAHAPLVDPEVFDAVQRRLSDGRTFTRVRAGRVEHMITRHSAQRPLIAGLLRCSQCGGPMAALPAREGRDGEMRCQRRTNGEGCTAPSYRLEPATEALLAQVRRLQGCPWTTGQEEVLAGDEGAAAQALDCEVAACRARLARATERFMFEVEQPTKEDREAFEMARATLGARIREIEQHQAALKHDAQALPRLRALHARLSQTGIANLIDRLRAAGADVELRDLLTTLVESAVLVERWPARRSTWLRLQVTWTPDVQRLLDAGLLTLAPEQERPLP